jgi:CDP-diacylglycerol--glycerol-3-phosphate 3-phosphatidyltransferase
MANIITLARFPLLLLIVVLLYQPSPLAHALCVPLVVILILMDSLDGIVARRRHETSVLGSVLDIMVDRSVELVLWVVYAHLRLVPVAIPLIVIVRGVLVDTLRNMQVSDGRAPFQTMSTRWGKFLVGSPAMRTPYAVVKLAAFAGLAATLAAAGYRGPGVVLTQTLGAVFGALSWVAVALCLARGLPVIIESMGRLMSPAQDQ